MKISNDGELVFTPIEGDFSAELEDIYCLAESEFGGFEGKGAAFGRRAIRPGEGKTLNPRRPENLEHLALSVGTVTVGYAAVYRDFPGKNFVELLFLYIAPAARRMGSGTRAIKVITDYFTQTGYDVMRVRVGIDERDALRFFYRAGFTRPLELEPAGDMYDDDFISLTLEKDMTGQN